MNVKAHVVVGQLGGLFLQLSGENDLPAAGNTQIDRVRKAPAPRFQNQHMCI